ncbi:hypothetical protein ABIB38_004841 [Massilia sp. UYP11]|uniref:hypothetical protein n=1 Tax=Massilia sp. UYP11 TaxID=1756385 RepID=UPI003D214820
MNAKAATAATNAPTAKDESKNTASAGNTKPADSANEDVAAIALAETAANLNAQERSALALRVLEGEADEQEQKLFGILQAQNTKAIAARGEHTSAIEAAVKALAGTVRPFGFNDMKKLIDSKLISIDVIGQVAKEFKLIKADQGQSQVGQTPVVKTPRVKAAGASKVFKSDSNPVFIEIPKAATDGTLVKNEVIRQGRTLELRSGRNIFGPMKVVMLRTKGATLAETEKNLAAHIVDEAYGKTEEGKTELKKIAAEVFASKPKKAPAATQA